MLSRASLDRISRCPSRIGAITLLQRRRLFLALRDRPDRHTLAACAMLRERRKHG
jgi:hypothetical protein